MKYFKPLAQAGDTIVEVMVVLAVLGSAITISYVTATRSLANARQAQENTQASEYVQAQIEDLHAMQSLYTVTATNIYQNNISYCTYYDASTGYQIVNTASDTANHCLKDNLYHIAIRYDSTHDDTFTATATWPDIQGQGNDTVSLVYRLHQP